MASIHALPQDTIRLLKSSVLITNPISIVKELVDNALDAHASSISVRVATNTVDLVQVRDTGEGISKADFDALGRRAHTSKLTTFEELTHVGGSTLGFRGEALASANVVGNVTITTKTVKDDIGSVVRLVSSCGGVEEVRPTAAEVGTTVEVRGLFEKLPSRKRQCVKEAKKTIASIRELLQAYAMARPRVRISLKVDSDPRPPWTYSPPNSTSATVHEVVLQVFGKEVASQCVMEKMVEDPSSGDRHIEELVHSQSPLYAIEAFLPKSDANLHDICNKGAFISIDSRPMANIGVVKKIVQEFRTRLKLCFPGQAIASPFIQLNIICRRGSYDINVAPSKDEVLFSEAQRVLSLASKLFGHVYPKGNAVAEDSGESQLARVRPTEILEERLEDEEASQRETRTQFEETSSAVLAADLTERLGHTAGSQESMRRRNVVEDESVVPMEHQDHPSPLISKNIQVCSGFSAVNMSQECAREEVVAAFDGGIQTPKFPSVLDLQRSAAAKRNSRTDGQAGSSQSETPEVAVASGLTSSSEERSKTPNIVVSKSSPIPTLSEIRRRNPFSIARDEAARKKRTPRATHVEQGPEAEIGPASSPDAPPLAFPSMADPNGFLPESRGGMDLGPGPGIFGARDMAPVPRHGPNTPDSATGSVMTRERQQQEFLTPPFVSPPFTYRIHDHNPMVAQNAQRMNWTPPLSEERPPQVQPPRNPKFKPQRPVAGQGASTLMRERRHPRVQRDADVWSPPKFPGAVNHGYPTPPEARNGVVNFLATLPRETQISPSPMPLATRGPGQSNNDIFYAGNGETGPFSPTQGFVFGEDQFLPPPAVLPEDADLPATVLPRHESRGRFRERPGGKSTSRVPDRKSRRRRVGLEGERPSGSEEEEEAGERGGGDSQPEDSRMLLMRRAQSIAADKNCPSALRRVPSGLLPLEAIPADDVVSELELPLERLGAGCLHQMVAAAARFDEYVASGHCVAGLPTEDLSAAEDVQRRLGKVVKEWAMREMGEEIGDELEVDIYLGTTLKGKGRA